ncbi:glycosyltransferase [Enterococcus cecorum]|uniref:glycosyltransferase n=2 Tax=Enterococcus cecorum TaxID=44008 RepID=UPI00200AF09D|nr:glycosyltransferase [Enterococcus cecorum]
MNNTILTGLIMVKNQEKSILETIDSVKELCDKIIVIDTGSTDNTVRNIKSSYPNINIYFEDWEENYGCMRNKCLKYVSIEEWILFIDSDEIIKSDCSYEDIHYFLNHIDSLCSNSDIVCTFKQLHVGRTSFYHTERIIKKTDSIYYYGYVHEEPRSKKNLIKFNTDIEIINKGSSKAELEKFDKKKRYTRLLMKNICEEPDNPRWYTLLTPLSIEYGILTLNEYGKMLENQILFDTNLPLSDINLRKTPYLPILLERYCVHLIKINKFIKAKEYISFSKKIFPNNVNFIIYEESLFLKEMDIECSSRLQNIINFMKKNDSSVIHEVSEGTEEGLSGIVVKLLIILGRYHDAKKIANQITDGMILDMLNLEINVLKQIE